mmetsp:Transcript_24230/g.61243  ORF Transcript_24230/g.61243 Transcript_24230/m.61243 type:complete len:267 (-) Transcript_24230:372-1172(-)
MKARVVSQLANHPSQNVFPCLLSDIRKEVDAQLRQMQSDMERTEEECVREAQAEMDRRGGVTSSRDYLLSLHKMDVEKTVAALPHLLSMSSQLDLDLLSLSSKELEVVLGVKGVESVIGTSSSFLRMVQARCEEIRHSSDSPSPTSFCSTSVLSAFLQGQVTADMSDDPVLVRAVFELASAQACSASKWRTSLAESWAFLEHMYSRWTEMEERMERAANEEESVDKLKELLSELDHSSLTNVSLRARLVSRIVDLTRAVVGKDLVM